LRAVIGSFCALARVTLAAVSQRAIESIQPRHVITASRRKAFALWRVSRCGPPSVPRRELSTLLGNVLDFLQAHEPRENLLMQDYRLRDEGVPGD
jgi:hypothetical protein